MKPFRSLLFSATTALGLLWAVGGCRALGEPTLMHYGFMEVRVRGPGIDTTCRAEAHYRYAGYLNPNASGWFLQYGRASDDPRGPTSEPDAWCQIMLLTPRPLEGGLTFRTDSPDPKTRMTDGALLTAPAPYQGFASPGLLQVEASSKERVRGRFHLTLPRFSTAESGPPLEVEGRFEVYRKPPPQ